MTVHPFDILFVLVAAYGVGAIVELVPPHRRQYVAGMMLMYIVSLMMIGKFIFHFSDVVVREMNRWQP